MSLPHNYFVFQTASGTPTPFLFFDSLDRTTGVAGLTDTVSGQTYSGTHGVGNGGLSAGVAQNSDMYQSSDLLLATVNTASSRRSGLYSTNRKVGAQYVIIPESGYYEFCFRGASGGQGGGAGTGDFGGGYAGGSGVVGTGVRYITAGTEVGFVIGKAGATGKGNDNTNGAGGGGTFIFERNGTTGNTLWFAAGGGGGGVGYSHGSHSTSNAYTAHATTSNYGRNSSGTASANGGTNGAGGGAGGSGSYIGSGGAGWLGNGTAGTSATPPQQINVMGNYAAMGGMKTSGVYLFDGGYGGGGAAGDNRTAYSHGGGGGGGYSGGAGSYYDGSPGGGGSYHLVSGTSAQTKTAFKNYGNGSATITYLGPSLPAGYSTSTAGLLSDVFNNVQEFKDAAVAMGADPDPNYSLYAGARLRDGTNNNNFTGQHQNNGFYPYVDSTSYNVQVYGVRTVYIETEATAPGSNAGCWGGRYEIVTGASIQDTYGGGGFFTEDSRMVRAATHLIGPNNAGVFQVRSAGGKIYDYPGTSFISGQVATNGYGSFYGMLFNCIARYN